MQHLRFPNESTAYREARNALLAEEMELRRQVERVAAHRRALPKGGEVKEDYVFEGESGQVRLSELFAPGKETLAVYSFMFGPERERPCPGCTHFLDALEGSTRHILQRINLGLYAVLGQLRGKAPWRAISDEIWPWVNGPPATELGRAWVRLAVEA